MISYGRLSVLPSKSSWTSGTLESASLLTRSLNCERKFPMVASVLVVKLRW